MYTSSVYIDNPGHVHDTPDYALFSGDIHQLMANSPDYAFIRLSLQNENRRFCYTHHVFGPRFFFTRAGQNATDRSVYRGIDCTRLA